MVDIKTRTKLPDKLSSLLLLAVKDAKKVQKSKNMKLDMDCWYFKERKCDKLVCEVCLAGSVIAKSLICKEERRNGSFFIEPSDFDVDTCNKLQAVNMMRTGDFDLAIQTMNMKYTPKQGDALDEARNIINADYGNCPQRANWKTYEKAAKILKKAGL